MDCVSGESADALLADVRPYEFMNVVACGDNILVDCDGELPDGGNCDGLVLLMF